MSDSLIRPLGEPQEKHKDWFRSERFANLAVSDTEAYDSERRRRSRPPSAHDPIASNAKDDGSGTG